MEIKRELPLLPLRDIVVFPSMVIPLFVGRDKSIKSLEVAMDDNKQIMLVAQKTGDVDDPQDKDIYSYGCLSKVLQLLKLPDGTVKVLVEGLERVKINSIKKEEKKFLNCEITKIKNVSDNDENKTLVLSLIKKFEKLTNLSKKDLGDFAKNLKSLTSTSDIADNICSSLNIQIFEKQKLLEMSDITKRLEKIYEIIEKKQVLSAWKKRSEVE